MATIPVAPDVGASPILNRPLPPEPAPIASEALKTTDQADLRLIIEEDEVSGSYVYKTIDRRTGEIVAQFPREEILQMRDEEQYAAGAVIRARA